MTNAKNNGTNKPTVKEDSLDTSGKGARVETHSFVVQKRVKIVAQTIQTQVKQPKTDDLIPGNKDLEKRSPIVQERIKNPAPKKPRTPKRR